MFVAGVSSTHRHCGVVVSVVVSMTMPLFLQFQTLPISHGHANHADKLRHLPIDDINRSISDFTAILLIELEYSVLPVHQ